MSRLQKRCAPQVHRVPVAERAVLPVHRVFAAVVTAQESTRRQTLEAVYLPLSDITTPQAIAVSIVANTQATIMIDAIAVTCQRDNTDEDIAHKVPDPVCSDLPFVLCHF